MAKTEDIDLLAGSRKMMLASLLRRMNEPQPNPWGAAANALSMGLMGLIENQDDVKALDAARGTTDFLQRHIPMGETSIPGASSEAPSPRAIASALHPASYAVGDETIPGPPPNPLAAYAPEFRERFPALRTAAAERGVTFDAPAYGGIGSVRSQPQQDALFAQGRTAPGPIVTGTRDSNHLTGNAADVVPTNGTTPEQVGATVAALTKDDPRFANMRSGATFKNLYDPLHVEIPRGQQQPMQVAQAQGLQAPTSMIQEAIANAEQYRAAGNRAGEQHWRGIANGLLQQQFKRQQELQFKSQEKMLPEWVKPERFTYDNREFLRTQDGRIQEITPPPAGGKTQNSYTFKEGQDLRQELMTTPQFKNIAQVAPVYKSMLDAAKKDDRAADLNMIYGMAKLMDPGSVVREGEVGLAQGIATLPQQLQSQIMSQLQGTGRLSPEVRAALMEQARSRINAYQSEYDAAVQLYDRNAASRGLNPDDIIPKFGPHEAFVAPPILPTREQAIEILRQRMKAQGR